MRVRSPERSSSARAFSWGLRVVPGILAAAALFFLWQQWIIRDREPAACFRAFLNNNYVGMSNFIGILLDHVNRS